MIKLTITFCSFFNVPRITPFRTSTDRKITKQPTLVTAQGTVYHKCPVLTGNHSLFLTENSLLCGVINYRVIHKSLQKFQAQLHNKDTAERSISTGRESLQVFLCTRRHGVLADFTTRRQ
jgi:hypothetical protein